MKLYTIKFANGFYLSRIDSRPWNERNDKPLTADINEAYIYHDPEYLVDHIEFWNDSEYYRRTMENGGGSYKLIEVKIAEVEDETNT